MKQITMFALALVCSLFLSFTSQASTYNDYQEDLRTIEFLKGMPDYIILLKEFTAKYSDLEIPQTLDSTYDEATIQRFAQVVESETHGGDFMSKVHVADVILNRVADERFPDILLSVLNQENQFAKGRNDIDETTYLAIEYAYMVEDTTEGALWFNTIGCKSWASRNKTYLFDDEIGHEFYK